MGERDLTLAGAIERFEAARGELDQTIRAAHVVIKDLRDATKDARDAIAFAAKTEGDTLREELHTAAERLVGELAEAVAKNTKEARDTILKGFEDQKNVCLYGNTAGTGDNIFDKISAAIDVAENDLKTALELLDNPGALTQEGRQLFAANLDKLPSDFGVADLATRVEAKLANQGGPNRQQRRAEKKRRR